MIWTVGIKTGYLALVPTTNRSFKRILEKMAQPEKANQAFAAIHNRQLILQLLRNGPLSRRQLVELTGLRGSTITYIVRDLLNCEVVRTIGKRESKTVGKKQILLEVNPNLGWVAGLGISTDWAFLTYMDMAGKVLDQEHFEIGIDLPNILKGFSDRVGAWASSRNGKIGKMLGVGVGVPGVVNVDTGKIKLSSLLKLQKYAIRDMVTEHFDVRVHVDNNVNLAAQAESRMGSGTDIKNFIYFHISVSSEVDIYTFKSIGTTLCLDGKPYRGAHYSAGEIDRLLQDTVPVSEVNASELLMMGEVDGDMTVGLNQLGAGTGRTLATICDLLDPQAVIVGSNTPFCNKQLIGLIESELNRHLVPVPDRHIPVIAAELGDHGVAMGAAITTLDRAVSNVENGVLSGLWNGS
jgi:predicted NBD/HSP70 family sugar kinase